MSPTRSSAASGFDLRRAMLQRLRLVDQAQHRSASEKIAARLISEIERQRISVLAAFFPLKSEPNLTPALRTFLAQGGTLLLPRLNGTEMVFVSVSDLASELEHSPLRFLQPLAPLPSSDQTPEAIALPGVVFGRQGERIGRGGGYYDRFLACRNDQWNDVAKIGICFSFQLSDTPIPQEPHDFRVDYILTEDLYVSTH